MRLCDPFPDPEDIRGPADPTARHRQLRELHALSGAGSPAKQAPIRRAAGEQVFDGDRLRHVSRPVARDRTERESALRSENAWPLFSDLLLHDIGTGDGIRQGAAEPNEIRTPALWGLRFRRPLLHDGTATVEGAILRHAREAELARAGFERLSDADRAALLAFLGSL